ncbi:hypothetical protein PR003_g31847 [Phytophthora rubi]|uniref:Uncharacterized protein n=1 Tax=Phytophthora rubi TaxID=129364 RepID=A0A6A3N1E1_9STRA|nr:hypothetical protein PR002_g24189 [Phytophthora rubi]KAE9035370.1 hypothetical protein PR001_g9341 [Phytophthora rubi]KAE9267226.1 hypothetical protein PR003_g31847 [Phytophthora rubi]
MKGGTFGPAITTGGAAGAAFAALGSLLANRVPPSLRSAAQCTHATHGTDTHTRRQTVCSR